MTLRHLLIQRAARLQERPALSAPDWGTLSYGAWRNRVEGIGLGLLAEPIPPGSPVFAHRGDAWDWAAETAAACCGLVWDPKAPELDPALFGGARFNDEHGRQGYHDRDDLVRDETPFHAGLTQGEVLLRLQRWNRSLGWDHATELRLPSSRLADPETRAALWNALYAGAYVRLEPEAGTAAKGWFGRARETHTAPTWDPEPFRDFWKP
ncbi:MAG TPA: hypothetical protein VJ483_04965 [Holophagaceae bacterium]|nr:hypothetical protein [Holophagaceae bacterium]